MLISFYSGCNNNKQCSGTFKIKVSGTVQPSASPSTAYPSFSLTSIPSGPSDIPTYLPSNPSYQPTNAPSFPLTIPPVTDTTSRPSLSAANDIFYYGGNIMLGQVTLYNIFYGDFSISSSRSTVYLMNYLASHIGNSSWYNIMTAYYDFSGRYLTKNVTFGGNVSSNPYQKGGSINDSTILDTITNLILSNQLPLNDNGIYAFIFRGDIQYYSALIGSSFLGGWCGYHYDFMLNGYRLKYFVIGDPSFSSSGDGCEGYTVGLTVNKNLGADSMASIYAHELVETVSNVILY